MNQSGSKPGSGSGAACPACGGSLCPWRVVGSAEPMLGPREFELWRCSTCGTAVTCGESVPEAHAAGAYGGGRPRGAGVLAPVLSVFDRQRLSLLPGPPARLVDAGAGRGRFVAAARAAGYDAVGVEPSLRDVDPSLGLIRGSIADVELPDGCADVVTLWHVLEHLEAPDDSVDRLRAWLVPDGTLVVGVPNLRSLQAFLSGGRWYHLDLPRHRVHYTVTGVSLLLRRHGFAVSSVRHALLEHNPFGMWQSLVSEATVHPSYLYNLLKRNAPLLSPDLAVTLAALPLAPTAALLEWAAGLVGFGGTVAVIARRL